MTILNEHKIKRFADRLLLRNAPALMKKGGAFGLSPIKSCRQDEAGNLIIPTGKIATFFSGIMKEKGVLNADQHIAALYSLLSAFSEHLNTVTFESDLKISEAKIHDADNKTKIEHLARNIIISYFNKIQEDEEESDGSDLLDENLDRLIRMSSSGRDYRTLVENTLNTLVNTLKKDISWRRCLRDMNDAELVCRLVGARLPKIDSSVVSRFIMESHAEVEKENSLLTRILRTKEQIKTDEKDLRKYRKTMQKLDLALENVLGKLDDYFMYAHQFAGILGLSVESFLGDITEPLTQNLAVLFFNYSPDKIPVGFSTVRFRLNQLSGYIHLSRYCRQLKDHEQYRPCFLEAFKRYYDRLSGLMDQMADSPGETVVKKITACTVELEKAVPMLGLEEDDLSDEKSEVMETYVKVIKTLHVEQINSLMTLLDSVCTICKSSKTMALDTIGKTLVSGAFDAVKTFDQDTYKKDDLKTLITKILYNYSMNYHPKRFFYQHFFKTCIGSPDGSTAEGFEQLIQTRKNAAKELLDLFCDPKSFGSMVPDRYADAARSILSERGLS